MVRSARTGMQFVGGVRCSGQFCFSGLGESGSMVRGKDIVAIRAWDKVMMAVWFSGKVIVTMRSGVLGSSVL
jgi:hypothetical protein